MKRGIIVSALRTVQVRNSRFFAPILRTSDIDKSQETFPFHTADGYRISESSASSFPSSLAKHDEERRISKFLTSIPTRTHNLRLKLLSLEQ